MCVGFLVRARQIRVGAPLGDANVFGRDDVQSPPEARPPLDVVVRNRAIAHFVAHGEHVPVHSAPNELLKGG